MGRNGGSAIKWQSVRAAERSSGPRVVGLDDHGQLEYYLIR